MRRYLKDFFLLSAAICLLLIGLNWLRSDREPMPRPLRMTAGNATGLRHKLALELASEAARAGIQIEVKPTTGSEAAIEALRRGEFDLAFVQGGLTNDLSSSIRQVSAMHIEPLHLLVKSDVFGQIETGGLTSLSGKRVNLGPDGSGTNVLATEVLSFAGLGPKSSNRMDGFESCVFEYSELLSMSESELPDAIFTVSSLPSTLADYLIEKHGYRLVPLAFGEALALEAFLQLGDPIVRGSIDHRHLYETRIPAYTYSVDRAEPPTAITTVGTRLLMVANSRVPNDVIARLLDTLYLSNFARAERPPLDSNLLDLPVEFPMHAGAEVYRQRNKPLIAGDAIDYWEKILAITATLVGGTFFVAQWYMRWSQRKREASFANYMERVLAIEKASMQTELSAHMDLAALIQLQRELAEIKSEAVRKFAAGELEGEGLINGFLAMVNDARTQLTNLILHQRNNIEDQAAETHLDPDKIWIDQSTQAPVRRGP